MHFPLAFFFSFLTTSFFLFPFFWFWCYTTFVHFHFFSVEKVLSVDENKTRGKLLNWRRMSASYTYGLCPLLLRSFQCYKFYVPQFFHWKRNQLSMPRKKNNNNKKNTHTHTLEASAHCSHITWTQYFGWHDLTLLDLTTDFQHQLRRKLTLSKQTNKQNKLMTFSPNNYYLTFKMIS